MGQHERWGQFSKDRGPIWDETLYRGKEVLINKLFDSTHKVYNKKTREVITSFVDTVKLRASKYSIERSQG